MRFITGGDFVFPFNFKTFFNEQIYLWSFNSGVPNLDEILRFFVRLPNLLIYAITGSNVAVSYFYIFSVALVCFLSFLYFAKQFIGIKDKTVLILLSLFYTFNPVFLGNYAKIGLILAATMLPLLLTYEKQYFRSGKFRYLIFIILAINVSLIHPFNLVLNFSVASAYFIALAVKERSSFLKEIPKILSGILLALMINAYAMLAVFSIGSIDKSQLSQNLSDTSLSSTNLLTIANTGDIFTAFSLSKNIFLDFHFYNDMYKYLYFVGVYILIGLMLALFLLAYEKLTKKFKKYLLVFVAALLVLILFSTGTFMGVDNFLSLLERVPGGWAFRSPLKWQLYIPLCISAVIVLLLETYKGQYKKFLIVTLCSAAILINGFVGYEVFKNLILPNSSEVAVQTNQSVYEARALLIKDSSCNKYFNEDFSLLNNIREAHAAESIQLKEIDVDDLELVNLSNFTYLIACSRNDQINDYNFKEIGNLSTSNKELIVFENERPKPKAYITKLIAIADDSYNFTTKQEMFSEDVSFTDFVNRSDKISSAIFYEELFETIKSQDVHNEKIVTQLDVGNTDKLTLHSKQTAYYKITDNKIELYSKPLVDTTEFRGQLPLPKTLIANEQLSISYEDKDYNLQNLVKNGSLEDGLWQQKVSDCFNYDTSSQISMALNKGSSTEGQASLLLKARRHVACTSPDEFEAVGDESYLVYFDYKTTKNTAARYNVMTSGFDKQYFTERLSDTKGEWKSYSKIITAPHDTGKMKLTLYGIPSLERGETTTYYDNIQVIKVPKVSGQFYITESTTDTEQSAAELSYEKLSPIKTKVTIKNATGLINVAHNDSFASGWELQENETSPWSLKAKTLPARHFKINRQENAWQINVDEYCKENYRCIKQEDSSYTFTAVIVFAPQRWFVMGLLISVMSLVIASTYIYLSYRRDKYPRHLESKAK